ncbi:hypothetical protein ACHAXA_003522 [Cyclostephanos tholiformis]|uniref:Uncharacterized protein n=1 Tax=Cyclostephanos tholiformis TaxID=382380 RepID=A0ABD3R6P8_9STRA
MMISNITIIILSAAGLLSVASLSEGMHDRLDLREFQQLLRTSLDSELVRIVDESRKAKSLGTFDQQRIHIRKSNVRRRANGQNNADSRDNELQLNTNPSITADNVWEDIMQHAWSKAKTIKRDGHRGLSVTEHSLEAHPCPFLVCGRKQHDSDRNGIQHIVALFGKQFDQSVTISSSHNETCLILTTTAHKVQQVLNSYEGRGSLVAVPLLDISKIHYGTIDEVSSQGWAVPFRERQGRLPDKKSSTKNETEAINDWERVISVNFAPGLGGMKEEAQLLDVVNKMMGDIQDMGEVGWLRSMRDDEAEQFLIDESLIGVPALSDMFSLTSSLRIISNTYENGNARIKFWHDSLKDGIESEHACSEMFTTLFVKPQTGYNGYDLVLNPTDGPPAKHYESSSSNPACVTSLIAALSAHPYVLSVKASFPIYHGWNVAKKLDAAYSRSFDR